MRWILLLTLGVTSFYSWGQDERFYRKMFSSKLSEAIEDFDYKIHVDSPRYTLDLNRDGLKDSFQTVKKDGVDFIRVIDPFGKIVFEKSLLTKGAYGRIFKARFVAVKKDVDVLILYYYEGETQSATFEGSARLYFLTIPGKDLGRITLSRGPYFWHERERGEGKYWNRRYSVNILDYNKDGVQEISVSYNKSSRVYFYISDGVWKSI